MTDDRPFAEWLLNQRLLTKEDLRRAMEAQRGRQARLDTEILDLGLMSEAALLEALGRFHKTRPASAADLEFASPAALRLLTPRIASRLEVVPFRLEGRTLSVATLSPGDLLVEDEIAQQTGCMVASFVTLEVRFVEALHRHYNAPITARYAGLVRRLHGDQDRPPEQPRRASAAADQPGPTSGRPEGRDEAPAAVLPRRRAPKPDDELELSGEDLDLFPSLRFEQISDDAEETDLSGVRTLQRGLPEPEPESEPESEPEFEPVTVPEPGSEPETPAPSGPEDFAPPVDQIGPEALLAAASMAMQNVEMRDDIADAMLGFCAPFLRRRAMLMHRQGKILGWRGEGAGIDEAAVRAIAIPADEPSVFSGLLRGVEFWLGPLPTMPHNTDLVLGLGGAPPTDCYILPVRVRDKVVCFLYGDNQTDGVAGLPLGELKRLAVKASLGFQVYLMKGKIRTS